VSDQPHSLLPPGHRVTRGKRFLSSVIPEGGSVDPEIADALERYRELQEQTGRSRKGAGDAR
jgi:hypothetical protein